MKEMEVIGIINKCINEGDYNNLDIYLINNKVDFFKDIDGIMLYDLVLMLCIDPFSLYQVTSIISKYSNLLKDFSVSDNYNLAYNLVNIKTSYYYILTIDLFLKKGLKEEVIIEMINRLNYEFEKMYNEIYPLSYKYEEKIENIRCYSKYFYYTYILLYCYLEDKNKAKRIIKVNNNYDINKLKDYKNYILSLSIIDIDKSVKVKVYDKISKTFIMELN